MKLVLKITVLIVFFSVLSCKKDKEEPAAEEPAAAPSGNLKIVFENMVGNEPLSFGKKFVNYNGDTFNVSIFNYFISNILLVKADNSTFSEVNSYHLVKQSSSSTGNVTVSNVPVGEYKSLRLILGVDSAHNVSGAQPGDLDPGVASDMYWGWTSGYVSLKLEGTAPKSGDPAKALEYHLGGYGGTYKAQRSIDISFGSNVAVIAKDKNPSLRLKVDVNELFTSPNAINLATDFRVLAPTSKSKRLADNYADMISFKSLEN